MAITKEEIFDADMLELLLKHDGIKMDVKNSLRKYKKRRANANHVALSYDYGKGVRDLQKGRLYVQPWLGLSSLPSDVRAALGAKYYDEIDMENSQPVLLEQLADKLGVVHPALTEFIYSRANILATLQASHTMTRDEAKQLCFRVFYGGLADEHQLFPALRVELQTLASSVIATFPEFEVVAKKSKEAKQRDPSLHLNHEGSVLAHYAQHLETTILLEIDAYLTSKGYSLDVLQHDGGMVRKKGTESISMSLLEEAQGVIFNKTGFRITLTIKPLKHSFQFVSSQDNAIVPQHILITDSWATDKFVKMVGERLRRVGTELYILNQDDIWDSGEFALRQLIEEYEDQLTWKQYNCMGFLVSKVYGSDVAGINKLIVQTKVKAKEGALPIQFSYLLAEPHEEKLSVIVRFCDLLRLASRKAPLYDYLLKWIAHIVQKPLDNPGVGIVLTGNKGVGKDTLFDFLMKFVLGKISSTNYDSNKQFFDKHDMGRKGKLLVKVEEANRKLCMENKDTLKSMVTASDSTFNPKNEKAVIVPNKCRFVFTSNKGNPLDFADGERRYVILPCSSEKKGDTEYWDSTYALLFNPEAGRTIGDWLMKIDLTGFQIRKLPANDYQNEVVEAEESSEQRFFDSWDGYELSSSDLYDTYRRFCQENDLPYAPNALSFGQRILPFLRDAVLIKRRRNNGVYYLKSVM